MNKNLYQIFFELKKQNLFIKNNEFVYDDLKIIKCLVKNINNSIFNNLINSNFTNYIISKKSIKVLFYENNYFVYLIFYSNSYYKEKYSYELYNLVISGPDGVGKSFIINKLKKTFNFIKDDFSLNHHMNNIKNKIEKQNLAFKIINKILLNILSILRFEFRYKKNLNYIFLKKLNFGLNITERFYIDRMVIFKLLKKNLLSYLFIRFIFSYPIPTKIILLNANTNKIYKNKQELSPNLIALYNPLMKIYFKKFKLKYLEIDNFYDDKTFEKIINFIIKENLNFLVVSIEKNIKF